jgi:hypothetical protein
MANTLSKPSQPTFFPNELNPSKKGKEYCLQFAKAAYWYNWSGAAGNAWGNPRRDDWVENRQWAIGNPNVERFVPMFSSLKDGAGNPASFLNLDLKPVCFIPKFIDIIVSYIEKLEYEISCDAVNPEAVDVKAEMKWKIYTAKKMQAWMEAQEATAGAKLFNTPQFDFDFGDKEELDLLFGMSVKLDEEMMMEMGNEVVLNESKWTLMKRMILKDLAVLGSAARETYVDPVTDRVKTRYIDMINVTYPYVDFRGEILDRPSRIGYIETMTVADLRAQAGDQFSDEEYCQIAARYSNQFGNGTYSYPASNSPAYVNTDSQFGYWYSFNIPVMTLYWEETDRYKYQDKLAKNGETYTAPASYKEPLGVKEYVDYSGETPQPKKKTVYPSDVHCYYQSKWIPGTDYIFNWGKVPDMGRDPLDPKYAICPLQIYRVSERSLLDRLLPFEEQNMLAWLKMQNTIAKAVPSGYSLNINTLKNASIDGKSFPVKHQVELYEQTGRLIWDSENPLDETGRPFPHPISQMPSNLANDIQAWLLLFDSNIQKMRGVTGINELMDASTPDARTLAGTAKLAVAGSQNALTPIANTITLLQEQNCMDIAEKLKLVIQRNGGYEGYAPAIGGNLLKATMDDRVCAYTYAIKVRAKPTTEERMDLKETAKAAVINTADPVKGGLMYSDYIYIVHLIDAGTNLKLVEAIMRHRIEKNLKKMSEMAQQNSQAQAEMNKQTIEQQMQSDLAKSEKEKKDKMELDTFYTDNKIRLAKAEAQFHLEAGVQKDVAKGEVNKSEIITKYMVGG